MQFFGRIEKTKRLALKRGCGRPCCPPSCKARYPCWRANLRVQFGPLRLARDSTRSSPALTSGAMRSEEHTSELQSLMRISYAVFCLKKNKKNNAQHTIIVRL